MQNKINDGNDRTMITIRKNRYKMFSDRDV